MALQLADKWIWDFWLVETGSLFHIFYLQAPKLIGDPDLRHWNVSIGHAVSTDLVDWEVEGDALGPGDPGAWDDRSTWTGSIVEHDGRWHLFYTGTSSREDGLVQRVGLATSDDLATWERHGDQPLMEADPRWYEKLDSGAWHDEAWRDPWVFGLDDGLFHATITARANSGPREGRGVVGHATSQDLLSWEVGPPLSTPDGFGQLEVSQVIPYGGSWYLVFCSDVATQSPARRSQGPGTGTYYIRSHGPLGPFDPVEARPLRVDENGTSYAGRLVDCGDDGLRFLAWNWMDPERGFLGSIADPVPVVQGADGDLWIPETP